MVFREIYLKTDSETQHRIQWGDLERRHRRGIMRMQKQPVWAEEQQRLSVSLSSPPVTICPSFSDTSFFFISIFSWLLETVQLQINFILTKQTEAFSVRLLFYSQITTSKLIVGVSLQPLKWCHEYIEMDLGKWILNFKLQN